MKQHIAPLLLMLVPGLAEAHDPDGMARLILFLLVFGQLLFPAVVASIATAIALPGKRLKVFALAFVSWPFVLATVVGLRYGVSMFQDSTAVSAQSFAQQLRFGLDHVIEQILAFPLTEICISAVLILSGVVVWRLNSRKARDSGSAVGP